jgi:hypothetical protein
MSMPQVLHSEHEQLDDPGGYSLSTIFTMSC